MEFDTLIVDERNGNFEVTIDRVKNRNTLNKTLVNELNTVLDLVAASKNGKIMILKGKEGFFCTGMDFKEVMDQQPKGKEAEAFSSSVFELLKKMTTSPVVIISQVEGKVMAGGVGIVAASDIVVATPKSEFKLTEAMWGLLPANILPFIIRRTGFQKAYWMTLTMESVSGKEAHEAHLVDLLTDDPDASVLKLLIKLQRLSSTVIGDAKKFFQKLWFINEEMEKAASSELARLVQDPKIVSNIENFVKKGQFPWEKD